jgi:hypothetical protein
MEGAQLAQQLLLLLLLHGNTYKTHQPICRTWCHGFRRCMGTRIRPTNQSAALGVMAFVAAWEHV